MKRLRILLIEDDAVISMLLAELLGDLGHDVCGTAATELAAITAAAQTIPDLMIVDANLAMGSGVSAMAAILQQTAMPHIFMTGGHLRNIPPSAIVLHKPFGSMGLKQALESVTPQVTRAGELDTQVPAP